MTWHNLYKKEEQERWLRLKQQSEGVYPLLYLGLGFGVFMGALLGTTELMFISVYTYTWINIVMLEAVYVSPLLKVKEQGKQQPILHKYLHISINIKRLCLVKLMILAVKIGKVVVLGFIIAVGFRLLEGGDLSAVGLLPLPFFLGGLVWLLAAGRLWWQYRQSWA